VNRYPLAVPLLLASLTACSSKVPEVLRGVTAGGGYWGACPQPAWPHESTLAISPEFNRRLTTRFPPGSPQVNLIDALSREGFKDSGTCESASDIRILSFHAAGIGLFISEITAQVYWQSDTRGRIVWTKGFVAYTGL
jgi:hypothetical protein